MSDEKQSLPRPGMRRMKLAHAYVPFQYYSQSYPPREALDKGTLFPELYMPYRPRRR
ncbi:spore coat associated protein CotJA [Natronospora cellulosivora (SeqCode)]